MFSIMKKTTAPIAACLMAMLVAGCSNEKNSNSQRQTHDVPQPKHVIIMGFDAMGSYGIQRAETPNLNWIMANGSGTMQARSVRPSLSSPNWMSMLTGAEPEMHGVTSNDWIPGGTADIAPAVQNSLGIYPTVLELFKQTHPEKKLYAYYEWEGQGRMYDMKLVDRAVTGKTGVELMEMATNDFFADKPDFLYVSILEPDDVGHQFAHEAVEYLQCITKYDSLIGNFVNRLRKTGLDKESVLLITADHGGIGNSHGADNPAEVLIPILLYGKGVTPGKMLTFSPSITDVAGTLAYLTETPLDGSASGKFLADCFSPMEQNGKPFAPQMPTITPHQGLFNEPTAISIAHDNGDSVSIFYTTDGTEPTAASTRYNEPVKLTASTLIRAKAIGPQGESMEAHADIRLYSPSDASNVKFEKFNNYLGKNVPDFATLGKPSSAGFVHEFSLDEIAKPEEDHFAVRLTATLTVDQDGLYMFGLNSDDGAKLYIDGKLVIDNDGSHSPITKRAWHKLTAGNHSVEVGYFENYMGQHLAVYMAAPGRALQTLPLSKLSRRQ